MGSGINEGGGGNHRSWGMFRWRRKDGYRWVGG